MTGTPDTICPLYQYVPVVLNSTNLAARKIATMCVRHNNNALSSDEHIANHWGLLNACNAFTADLFTYSWSVVAKTSSRGPAPAARMASLSV